MKHQNLKAYRYAKGTDETLDQDFSAAKAYGRVKLGNTAIFWKVAFHWYALPLDQVRQVYRRVENVYGKLCCGSASYDIQSMVLVLKDGTELELVIGSNEIGNAVKKEAEKLLQAMQQAHPELKYGKE